MSDAAVTRSKSFDTRAITIAAIWLVVAASVFHVAAESQIDPDLWRHLKFGIDTFSPIDKYSYLSSPFDTHRYPRIGPHEWINHEWLSDEMLGSIFSLGGWLGLVLFKTALSAATLLIMLYWIKKMPIDPIRQAIAFLIITFFLGPTIGTIRPQLFTCLGLSILLTALRLAERNKAVLLLGLPAMFALWTNLHGGFLVGLATIGAWAGLSTIDALRTKRQSISELFKQVWPYWLSGLLCTAATLVNPYGEQLLVFIGMDSLAATGDVAEWIPIHINNVLGLTYLIVLVAGIASTVDQRCRGDWRWTAMWYCFAFSPFLAVRHMQLFAIATPILLGDSLAKLWNLSQMTKREPPQWEAFFVGGLAAIGSLLIVGHAVANLKTEKLMPGLEVPWRAVRLLKESGVKGNLLCDFNWGDYIIWQLGPDVRVSYDGRREGAYSRLIQRASVGFQDGLGNWDLLIDKYPTNMVLISPYCAGYNLMRMKPGWRLIYEDNLSALFCPEGSAIGQQITSHNSTKTGGATTITDYF